MKHLQLIITGMLLVAFGLWVSMPPNQPKEQTCEDHAYELIEECIDRSYQASPGCLVQGQEMLNQCKIKTQSKEQ